MWQRPQSLAYLINANYYVAAATTIIISKKKN